MKPRNASIATHKNRVLRVGFDIGGVISRYPVEMKAIMWALVLGGAEIYIVTDMNPTDAAAACRENDLDTIVPADHIISANWSDHGDLCKTKVIERLKLDFMLDDRADYCAAGDFIGFVLSPRPHVPYYHKTWVNRSTPAVCVPPEQYEEFQKWRKQNGRAKAKRK